ncbi:PREDICTED: uncharacterized protein LOC109234646 [Nicotiana attenuata]|uniref:uncharacterized protein LOC109234646 n=1 Tax=Nicotiana attenuata TaxID=49451 RepID=UPI0009047C49|nr:PREDICTED: uncharacterized protein LOC109234646 [Nicotiana attenuata]
MLTCIEFDKQIPEVGSIVDRELEDKGGYQRLVGRLLYLTMTRPDIAFGVQVLSQYMHAPKVSHMEAAQRVVRYIKTAPGLGLFMSAKASKSLVVSRSSAEAEFRSMASIVAEVMWITGLFKELVTELVQPIQLHCDSKAAIQIATHPIFHARTKHIDIDCHFEQYQQILHLQNKDKEVEQVVNDVTAGTTEKYDEIPENARSKVYLPTGEQVSTTHTGIGSFFKNKRELSSGKVLGIGKGELGMYILKEEDRAILHHQGTHSNSHTIPGDTNKCSNLANSKACDVSSLWHQILGHAPLKVLRSVDALHNMQLKEHHCTVCPIAKQSRLPFPTSSPCSNYIFDIVHDTVEVIKSFIAVVSTQFDHKLKCLRTDNGTEFFNDQMKKGDKFCPKAIPVVHMGDIMYKEEVFPFKHMTSGASPLFLVLEFVEQPPQPVVDLDDVEYPATSPSQYSAASPSQHSTDSFCFISAPLDLGQPILSSPISTHVAVGEPSVPSIALRKSSRTTKPAVWLADYVVPPAKSAYPISNYVAYYKLSSAYRASLAAFSAIVEP